MSLRLEAPEVLHDVGREVLSSAAAYGKGFIEALQNERQRDKPLIHQLADAIHALMRGITTGNPEIVDQAAPITHEVLRTILSQRDLKQHFKNYAHYFRY